MSAIGSRILVDSATGKRTLVTLEAPISDSDGVWQCSYWIAEDGATAEVKRACGSDALQALSLALEGVRIALRDRGGKLSWLGQQPGMTGFHRVPALFGFDLVEKIEAMIDAEVDKYVREGLQGQHPGPASD